MAHGYDTDVKTSARLRRVRPMHTMPELAVRGLLDRLGYRYRLHARQLPGCPDIVFPGRRKVIFVNGCFWHRHRCPRGRSMPAVNERRWTQKFRANIERDRRVLRELKRLRWKTLVVWECQTSPGRVEKLRHRLLQFLQVKT
ncbi:MAG: DNA mismatch endonuclease Vsr [Planctomycetota bacterium]